MEIKRITPEETNQLLDSNTGYVYLDVRAVPELDAGHVPGAKNVPVMEPDPYGRMDDGLRRAKLQWKPRRPLQILLVRLYRLGVPQTIPFLAYAGCKSWVGLEQNVSLGALTPVLSEEKFRAKAEMVRRALTQRT